MDPGRSASYPQTDALAALSSRRVKLLGIVGIAALAACAPELDTSRPTVQRGTVGEEVFGVLCDRVGAQSLREDLTGASFHAVCHKDAGGQYADEVDQTKLPSLDPDAVDEKGAHVDVDKQTTDRTRAIGKIESLGRRRADLIRAIDATLPDQKVPIVDLHASDETKSCNTPKKSGEGSLPDQLAEMLGRMGDLYNDGTLPQSTESLAHVVDTFKQSEDAQAAWARISAREGYRPIDTALGVARPMIAYPHLRDLSNASLALLSADSKPYQLDAQYDGDGHRIPVPGPGNAALVTLLQAAQQEMLAAKADPKVQPLVATPDTTIGRVVLSRPRDNLEMMQELLYATDPAYGAEGSASHYIVKRDSRGYAAITGGAVPSPFLDADKDGLPDVDDVGRFKTSNGTVAPSPFPFPGAPKAARDSFGRATAGSQLLYDYIDTSHTFGAQLMTDLKPLTEKGTMMDAMGGVYVAMGPRDHAQKVYGSTVVEYDGFKIDSSPMIDLVYAMGAILGDKTADTTLALTKQLFSDNQKDLARVTGAMLTAQDAAKKHDEAKIPKTSTFWDENLDVMVQLAQEPGLLEDILRALADPATQQLGTALANFAKFKDEVSYDKNDINGAPFNVTTNSTTDMKTPVDRAQPETGKNRSGLYRFLQLVNDTTGVTACNKPDAKVHAKLAGISVTMPIFGTYKECEAFKIDNLAAFYVDSIADASQYYDGSSPTVPGAFYLRDNTLRTGIAGIGAATVGLMQDSSGLLGFWTDDGSGVLAAKPSWLNRLVFFDLQNDNVNTDTKDFIADLQGEFIGSSVCPERVIDDPVPDAPDASPDGKVHGLRNCADGQWIQQRGKNTLFMLEEFGFYDAIKPLVGAFAKHHREDLFIALSNAAYKHWPGQESSVEECKIVGGKPCPKSGADSYEALLVDILSGDVIPALSQLTKALDTMTIKRCDAINDKGACSKVTNISGIDAVAAATRATLDPQLAKAAGLTDRHGTVTALRNDGKTNPQVTPAYLLTSALDGMDDAFEAYAKAHPEDPDAQKNWKNARSNLVDQFLGVTGAQSTAKFTNPGITKITPVLVDMLRSQLFIRCASSFQPPYARCTWARDDLWKHAADTISGPLMSMGLEVMDSVRRDPEGRKQMELLLQYLVDAASANDALPSMLASTADMVQVLRDDQNLVPMFHVLASAMESTAGDDGKPRKSMVDAQMALLARVSGKYVDKDGTEICSREIDPNQILAVALGNLVTPIDDEDFKGQTPLEVIIDVIADVNRDDPSQPYDGTLQKTDYAKVSDNIVDFLSNKERGLEQFYEVIRQGTK